VKTNSKKRKGLFQKLPHIPLYPRPFHISPGKKIQKRERQEALSLELG